MIKQLKKIFLLILLVMSLIVAVFGFSACDDTVDNGEVIVNSERFVPVETGVLYGCDYLVCYDKNTMVMYVVSYGGNGYGRISSFSVLLDTDGEPMKYKGE